MDGQSGKRPIKTRVNDEKDDSDEAHAPYLWASLTSRIPRIERSLIGVDAGAGVADRGISWRLNLMGCGNQRGHHSPQLHSPAELAWYMYEDVYLGGRISDQLQISGYSQDLFSDPDTASLVERLDIYLKAVNAPPVNVQFAPDDLGPEWESSSSLPSASVCFAVVSSVFKSQCTPSANQRVGTREKSPAEEETDMNVEAQGNLSVSEVASSYQICGDGGHEYSEEKSPYRVRRQQQNSGPGYESTGDSTNMGVVCCEAKLIDLHHSAS
ncbi:hypothetical protein B0H14DRAFT_2583256 [Mycena olivaceomarginata]|nr:hypothetical protein B0H14DRAFT_2583256 [Mycena olivaceomarginata]